MFSIPKLVQFAAIRVTIAGETFRHDLSTCRSRNIKTIVLILKLSVRVLAVIICDIHNVAICAKKIYVYVYISNKKYHDPRARIKRAA